MVRSSSLGIRWTIGDVSDEGWEALRYSLLGAWRLFGVTAQYSVCVNSISTAALPSSIALLPFPVTWHHVTRMNAKFLPHCDESLSEGTSWKFSPVRLFPDCHELALDNDCILWRMPAAITNWLKRTDRFLLAADVVPANGAFSDLVGAHALNSGIRGYPPGFDYESALLHTLERTRRQLRSELDEQGLQVHVTRSAGPCEVVPVEDVTICSPFPPHVPELGRCGAHFVGLNARKLPWNFNGRPAADCRREHWREHRALVARLVGDVPSP
ncbi:MAG TPA: hypothetical protein VGD78_21435 [Chthoniobacterales bacterium]